MNRLAQARISLPSVTDKRAECLPDVVPNYQISCIILISGLIIDDNEPGAMVFRHLWKTCRRPHHQRRSDRDEEIAVMRQFGGAPHRLFRHSLAERNGCSLDRLFA